MITIYLARARELLVQARDTQPEGFRYRDGDENSGPRQWTCSYIPDPESPYEGARITGCLIGTALKLAGLPDSFYEEFPNLAQVGIFSLSLRLREADLLTLSADAVEYFGTAQEAQDNGDTWHEAVAVAEHYIS